MTKRSIRARECRAGVDVHLLKRFAASLKGQAILHDDKQYSRARRVWNRAVNAYPAIIARCANVDDIVRAVEFSHRHDLVIAVRSGGHSFAGYGVCDGGIVVDLSIMKQVQIDPSNLSAKIQSGVLAGELDCVTQAFEMAVPLGSCPSVGVSGYTLGGGEGSLTPKFGYGCDSLSRVEIVTADGHARFASEEENADLFWAVRGAGANFGIATTLEFRLHPIKTVLSGHLKYPMRQAQKVLTFLASYVTTIPDELFLIAAVLPYPGERLLDIAVVWPGDEKKGQRVLHPLRRFIRPFEDTIKMNAYLDEQRSGTGTPGDGEYSSHRRSGHVEELTQDVIDVIAAHTSKAPSEASGITMIYWHGPWCSERHDNAFGFRRTGFEYWIHSYWKMANERSRSSQWVEQFFEAIAPMSSGAVYVNGLEKEPDSRVKAAYGDNYERLRQIKRVYDPDNFFRMNQNIRPAELDGSRST